MVPVGRRTPIVHLLCSIHSHKASGMKEELMNLGILLVLTGEWYEIDPGAVELTTAI